MPLSPAAEPPLRGVRALAQPAHVPLTHPVVFHEDFAINPVPDGHRFPMPKDVLLHRRLTDLGLARRTFTPEYPQADTLRLAHTPEYVEQFLSGSISQQAMRQIGLAWSPELRQRTLIGVGSAVLAARLALQFGCAVMCNGGTHHAHPGHGSGTALLLCSCCAPPGSASPLCFSSCHGMPAPLPLPAPTAPPPPASPCVQAGAFSTTWRLPPGVCSVTWAWSAACLWTLMFTRCGPVGQLCVC